MIWEPFALAILFGLMISAGIYFVFVWPSIEPEELEEREDPDSVAPPEAAD